MNYAFFHTPAFDPETTQGELHAFLSRHRIRDVSREFVAHVERSAWCLCVQYEVVVAVATMAGGSTPPTATSTTLPTATTFSDSARPQFTGAGASLTSVQSGTTPCGTGEAKGAAG